LQVTSSLHTIKLKLTSVEFAEHAVKQPKQNTMKTILLAAFAALTLLIPICNGDENANSSALLQPLIDPAKLATLGERGANPRIQKITAILWAAKQDGQDPEKVAGGAVKLIGWGDTEKGRLTIAAMVRNLTILERLGGTTPEDLHDMRRGKTADVRKGPYTGDLISVDHIIPVSIAPELDTVIANLELMPLRVNMKKTNKVGARQVSLAKSLHKAGLLSDAGLQRVIDPSTVVDGEKPVEDAAVEKTHWITTSSGIRHNSGCRWYKKSKGRAGGSTAGRACKQCGG
jgi:hypothetical protein